MKPAWKIKRCGCVKTRLPSTGERIIIRCERHRDKPAKGGGGLAHFEDIDGTQMVRRG